MDRFLHGFAVAAAFQIWSPEGWTLPREGSHCSSIGSWVGSFHNWGCPLNPGMLSYAECHSRSTGPRFKLQRQLFTYTGEGEGEVESFSMAALS